MRALRTLGAIALLALVAGAAIASSPTLVPTITNTAAGTLTPDNTYLWSWEVFGGQKPSLSHFVLVDLCDEVYTDIVPGSFKGGVPVEFGHDPTTNTDGLKFEAELGDSETGQFGFETQHEWEVGTLDVAFKSGRELYLQEDVVGPHCGDDTPAQTPEPATLGLLGLGAAGILKKRLRRTQRVIPE